ncbi:speckle-type POZ protein B [Caerostris darwini]|uniref:Speckle-type POZ protein B n=1 Tax=Caerostris darwini TaxID=1538125 RepID=A0AAV4TMI0_9ARAC|nr:speckle-type POZ protein B [Caerostris darwini]
MLILHCKDTYRVEKILHLVYIGNFSTLQKGKELTCRINSTLNDKLIVTLKLSVIGDDETLLVRFISSDSEVDSRYFSIKFSVLDSNGDTVTCGEAEAVFHYFAKESVCLLTLTKKEIMKNKCQYLEDDVLSLLYHCNFSTGIVYQEIENTNYGWIPPKTANACLPDLKLAENTTATTNPCAPAVLKRDIELMLHENVLCDVKLQTGAETFPAHCFRDYVVEIRRLNQIYRSNDLDFCLYKWMCSVVLKLFYSTPKMTLAID